MALSGHLRCVGRCPLSGAKRTLSRHRQMSGYDAVDGACPAASKCHRLVASKPERLKEVRPCNDDGVLKFWRNWRGHDDVMQTRSIRGSGEPVWVIALLKCALTIGTRSAQSIMASGFTAAQTGRTHDRTRPMLQKRQKVLAKAAPSTHDPKRTLAGPKSCTAAVSCHGAMCYPSFGSTGDGWDPPRFRTFQVYPKDLASRSVAR
jgi:hypothetical protein